MGNSESSENEPEATAKSSPNLSVLSTDSQPSVALSATKRNLNTRKDVIIPTKSCRHIDVGRRADRLPQPLQELPAASQPPVCSLVDLSVLEGQAGGLSGARFCHKQLPESHIDDLSVESYLGGWPSSGADAFTVSEAATKGTSEHSGDESLIDIAHIRPFKCHD